MAFSAFPVETWTVIGLLFILLPKSWEIGKIWLVGIELFRLKSYQSFLKQVDDVAYRHHPGILQWIPNILRTSNG